MEKLRKVNINSCFLQFVGLIEPSKSSRAKCRQCGEKIMKDTARVAVEYTFRRGDDEFTSNRYYHLDCAIKHLPEEVLEADLAPGISEEDLEKLEEFKKKGNRAGVSIIGIHEVTQPDKIVNVEAKVLRKLKPKKQTTDTGKTKINATVFVEMSGERRKIVLWEPHHELELKHDDVIVVLKGKSELASNEAIVVHAQEDTIVLVNPSEEEIYEYSEPIELYVSKAWERPKGKQAKFEYAPSGRATCKVCQNKIPKGEIKVVKPVFVEIPNGRTIPGVTSLHPHCALKDEHGEELLHEAITRLDSDFINENHGFFAEYVQILESDTLKDLLSRLL